MKGDPILTRAARLSRSGRYGEAIRLLEGEIFRYRDSFTYHYTLAASCLYSEDYGGAFTYFKQARDIKMREPSVLLGMALLFLRRGEISRAVDLYLEIQDVDPENPRAKEALNIIRKYGDPDTIKGMLESGKLKKIFPPLPGVPFSPEKLVLPLAAGLAAVLALVVVVAAAKGSFNKKPARGGAEETMLEKNEALVQTGGSYRYVLTSKQVLDNYEKARKFFLDYRDEAAKVELNRIVESNAAEGVKNKARLLLSYTTPPGFDTLRDRYSYAEASVDPVLYRDCYVIWRGMAANLDSQEQSTSFDLLVGYDTRSTMEGIVPVHFPFAIALDTEQPLEVLGRLIPASGSGDSRIIIRLEGAAIHQAPGR
ncbi:MAG: tetratricopeptide repeat protein [Spirochaetaceae bacterium]|jgi:tetratricopeptide (TPR) repeat protein|nr:tetratricopeptide repeat protein [Spirochaetaceae bacterium]